MATYGPNRITDPGKWPQLKYAYENFLIFYMPKCIPLSITRTFAVMLHFLN